MKIKICEANADRLEAALQAANGSASKHTFTSARELISRATDAEIRLEKFHLLKPHRKGVSAVYESGTVLRRSRKRWLVITTVITIERGRDAWFLTHARRAKKFPEERPLVIIRITSDQDAEARARRWDELDIDVIKP